MKKKIVQIVGLVGLLTILSCLNVEAQDCPIVKLLSWQVKAYVKNHYKGKGDGGYITVEVTHNGERVLVGLIRLKGKYHKDTFIPETPLLVSGMSGRNFKNLIEKYFKKYRHADPKPHFDTGVFRNCKWFY